MLRGFYAQGLSANKPGKADSDLHGLRATTSDSIDSSVITYTSGFPDAPHEYKPAFPFEMQLVASALAQGVDGDANVKDRHSEPRAKSIPRMASFSPGAGIFVMIRGFYAQGLSERPKPTKDALKSSRSNAGPVPDFSLVRARSSATESVASSVATAVSTSETKAAEYSPSYRFDLTSMLSALADGVDDATDDMIRLPRGILV
ncbi:hypothetical protein ACHHYP_09013 [Achlya hypogyna]|uniref:Uncharacterized protein n=1 Tax=Achlya hypogyna TaxID=1202772 RepID=A0A1V9ZJL1_ACHHY|nr:hypothetical protein ACHHYP_09013 [Achlya hypogyna]